MTSQTPGDTSPEQPGELGPPAPDSWSQPTPDSWAAPLSAPGATYPAAAQPPSGQIPPTTTASDPYGQFAPGQYPPGPFTLGPFTPGPFTPGQSPPGPYPPGPYGYPQQFYAPTMARNNPFAITALVSGIVQFVLGFLVFGNILAAIPAIVFGAIALRQIRLRGERGRGMAIAGLVLGILGVLYFALIIIAFAVGVSSSGSGTS